MRFVWDEEKNALLKATRGVSFQDAAFCIEHGYALLDVDDHPNQARYPGQKMAIVNINGYAYLVPYVEKNGVFFLKTIIPSRKATKKYLEEKGNEEEKN